MLYIGIDVAKSKHDCFIIDSDGVVYTDNLRITNDRIGFNKLLETILNALDGEPATNAKVGLEHTGHYSINIKRFLESQGFVVTCFNPLETSAFRKASTLRRTKTDKCDAKIIATMLFSDESIPTSSPSYQIRELKSLTRHRFRLIGYRGKLKVSFARIIDVVFPEDGSDLSYDIDFSYGLEVPLAFGPDLNIGYSTDFNDWNDTFNSESSSSDYTLDFREITIRFDFVNTIPLTLGVTADAIDVDGATMSDISVELSGSIAAGNIGAETSTPLTVRLTASQDALERFDGLRLNISATAAENADLQGITLNKAQGIRLENISASLDGGVQFDPFQKEE